MSALLQEALAGRFIWLEKPICTRDRSKPARSEARGKGRERGNLIEITFKPHVAQRAGDICAQRQLCEFKKRHVLGEFSLVLA